MQTFSMHGGYILLSPLWKMIQITLNQIIKIDIPFSPKNSILNYLRSFVNENTVLLVSNLLAASRMFTVKYWKTTLIPTKDK